MILNKVRKYYVVFSQFCIQTMLKFSLFFKISQNADNAIRWRIIYKYVCTFTKDSLSVVSRQMVASSSVIVLREEFSIAGKHSDPVTPRGALISSRLLYTVCRTFILTLVKVCGLIILFNRRSSRFLLKRKFATPPRLNFQAQTDACRYARVLQLIIFRLVLRVMTFPEDRFIMRYMYIHKWQNLLADSHVTSAERDLSRESESFYSFNMYIRCV